MRTRAGLDRKERRFPRKGAINDLFSTTVNRSTSLLDLLEGAYGHLYDHREDLEKLQLAYGTYKRERSLVDYDDLPGTAAKTPSKALKPFEMPDLAPPDAAGD